MSLTFINVIKKKEPNVDTTTTTTQATNYGKNVIACKNIFTTKIANIFCLSFLSYYFYFFFFFLITLFNSSLSFRLSMLLLLCCVILTVVVVVIFVIATAAFVINVCLLNNFSLHKLVVLCC